MPEFPLPDPILMATDLSARCDRALARSALLARAWASSLVVVHSVHPDEVANRDRLSSGAPSWRRPESWTQTLDRALRADLSGQGIEAAARIVLGSPAEAVEKAVADDGVGLVVLGISKDARTERIRLGSTVDALLRHSRVPVLNVRTRPGSGYRHVVVATDFSEPSLHALRLAAHWFEGAKLTLFHAYVAPGSGLTTGVNANEAWRATLVKECDSHLEKANLPGPAHGSLERVLEQGAPEALLADYVIAADADLVVLGSQGRSGLARTVLGSTAEKLLHALDCDTLVVRGA